MGVETLHMFLLTLSISLDFAIFPEWSVSLDFVSSSGLCHFFPHFAHNVGKARYVFQPNGIVFFFIMSDKSKLSTVFEGEKAESHLNDEL